MMIRKKGKKGKGGVGGRGREGKRVDNLLLSEMITKL